MTVRLAIQPHKIDLWADNLDEFPVLLIQEHFSVMKVIVYGFIYTSELVSFTLLKTPFQELEDLFAHVLLGIVLLILSTKVCPYAYLLKGRHRQAWRGFMLLLLLSRIIRFRQVGFWAVP